MTTVVVYVPYSKSITTYPPVTLLERWLSALKAEAERASERYGDLRGPVLLEQRVWSRILDLVESEQQAAS